MAKEAAAGIVAAQKPPAGKGLESALQELISNVPAVKRVLVQARERGFVTHDEINAALPEDEISPEVVDELIAMFDEMGVTVGGGEANGAAAKDDLERDEDEEEPEGGAAFDEDLGRTDDPVRMYLREMGTIELLSREGEIEIAKRIEAGRNTVLEALCESPLTMRAIISWRDAIGQGKVLLRDVIDLEATYGGAPQPQSEEADPKNEEADPSGKDAKSEAGEARAATADSDESETESHEGEDDAESDTELDAESDPESDPESDDDEFDETALSLSSMEASVRDGVLDTFDRIAEAYEHLRGLQERRLAAVQQNQPNDPKLDAA
jgi:RNA polymerase primary sigma factor